MEKYNKVELEYETEVLEDNVLKDIKKICYAYLEDPVLVQGVTDDELMTGYVFLTNKMKQLITMQQQMDVKPYSYPLTEVAKTLDVITINTIDAYSQDKIKTKLSKDMSNVIESMGMTFGVLNKIARDRNVN